MLYKRTLLTKILNNGMQADFAIVNDDGEFKAALYLNGRYVPGPALPQELTPAKDDTTHWMGNKPGVGLTTEEAEKIIREVKLENSVIEHRKKMSKRISTLD
jgi:hypothetical protein